MVFSDDHDFSQLALLVIDMQQGYFKDEKLQSQLPALIEAINWTTRYVRDHGGHVVRVNTVHETDKSTWTLNMLEDDKGFMFPDTEETESVVGLDESYDIEITKTRDSAFIGTPLLDILRQMNVATILLAGVSAHSCIFQTAADAYAHNLRVVILEDAVGDERPGAGKLAMEYLQTEYRQQRATAKDIRAR